MSRIRMSCHAHMSRIALYAQEGILTVRHVVCTMSATGTTDHETVGW